MAFPVFYCWKNQDISIFAFNGPLLPDHKPTAGCVAVIRTHLSGTTQSNTFLKQVFLSSCLKLVAHCQPRILILIAFQAFLISNQ